ncbi:hypothetical protein VNI00_013712 [Paramarasmius palmivorus]|uniref:Peroxidase n=1 Tax=Paramarasmius palmivorus TaxID=297713 RepID=A0AAW0BXR3_9AGAR
MLPSLSISLLGVGAVVAQTQFANLHWPYDPTIEYLEGLLYESTAMSSLAANCVERNDTTVSAQWVRIGYHDMSTHNIHDGTGGLDASIRFELDRGENVGIGMRRSLEDFIALQRTYASMADLIAMGVVLAYPSCGAPFFPSYRAGRVDATSAGPPGVPEPQQDVQTHIEKFANQGFDQSEMIALIACGHAFGGVRKADFRRYWR